ncbi:GNAT family N-acetyltransferase [uncultured Ramlibacter sp.]|uniref:GNAT family N-acetyltransferase n=1 Tax=uncultured Ramlibacter sp. TaxID=260755 RepID=UPI002603B7B7|nr:GNAT family N-acetyltransferase [uncultured Ramlibacter sp.]
MQIRQGHAGDEALVAQVLEAAAASLRAKGRLIWGPSEINEAAVRDQVKAGMYHIGFDGEGLAGVFRIQWEDQDFWPEMTQADAAYVHKLAVPPHRQGRGIPQVLLAHACTLARKQGRRYLRLDCMGGQPGLRNVYESFGFQHHSEKQMGEHVFDRFELDLAAPALSSRA